MHERKDDIFNHCCLQNVEAALIVATMHDTLVYFHKLRDDSYLVGSVHAYTCISMLLCMSSCVHVCICNCTVHACIHTVHTSLLVNFLNTERKKKG